MNNNLDIVDFFNTYYRQQAQNKNYQSIASAIDGLLPSRRKVLHTVLKNNITSWIKVEGLANKTASETEYLGGASNLSGVIVTMSKSYETSNNLPLMETKGNFGQRLNNKPGEPRYIFVKKLNDIQKYFKDIDNKILVEQVFEGTKIEPRFFVPILPMLLINGNDGIGSGHSQKIFSRSINDIKTAIKTRLKGEPISTIKPSFKDFNGLIEQGENDNQWLTYGTYSVNKNIITITDLPVGYSLLSYTKKLDKLEDTKKIKSYEDLSNTKTDKFLFKVKVDKSFNFSRDNIIKVLALSTKMSENFTSMDENNSVLLTKSVSDIIDYYIGVKIKYLDKRKDYLIDTYNKELNINIFKKKFIEYIINEDIIINKKTKLNIEKQIKSKKDIDVINDSYNYLLNMPIYSLTSEKIKELNTKIKELNTKIKELKKSNSSDIWIEELEELGDNKSEGVYDDF